MTDENLLAEFNKHHHRVGIMDAGDPFRNEALSWGAYAIRDVIFTALSEDAVELTWEILSPDSGDVLRGVWLSIYVDGVYYDSTQTPSMIVGGLTEATHAIDLVLENEALKGAWVGFSSSSGSQLNLDWSDCAEIYDVASYRLYWNSGTGDVSFTTAWQTVDTIEATHLSAALPTSGTGTGLLTSSGDYTGDYVWVKYQV